MTKGGANAWPVMCRSVVVFCILAGWLAGCNTGGARDGVTAASAVRDPVLTDIPKPQGFELVEDRSIARDYGQLRFARCEYLGPTNVQTVKRFYEEYMPAAQFSLLYSSLENGEYSLHFQSSSEVCNIRIRPRGTRTVVVMEVGPLPRGSADRAAEPAVRRP